jgi:hypothetical protein
LGLALSDAKSTRPDRHPQNRRRFVAAALLKAIRKSKLIDVKSRVERLYGDNPIHELKTTRYLAPEIDETITRLASKHCNN